jgi:hypothetical protein
MTSREDDARTENARKFIAETWKRARINAFAHRIAHEKAIKKARQLDAIRISATLLSLFSIIAMYILTSADAGLVALLSDTHRKEAALLATIASITLTFVSLYFDFANTLGEYRVAAQEHKYFLGSFQYIAQRAREAKWPDRPYEQLVELLHDLEKDFQLLKARGTEPTDEIFEEANAIFAKIASEPVSRTAQSFPSSVPSPTAPEADT